MLRVTPFDFLRSSSLSVGGLTTSQALGYYRWLSLSIPPEYQRALNRWTGTHPFQRPPIPLRDGLDRWLVDRIRCAVAPPGGNIAEAWRRSARIHADDLLREHRLPVLHWDERVSLGGLDRIQAQPLPFDPNQFHSNARHVTHATMEPSRAGWLVRLHYDDTRFGNSSWTLDYEIRDARLSISTGMHAIADHLLDPRRSGENQAWFQSLDYKRAILLPRSLMP